jgi:hypothetical protein
MFKTNRIKHSLRWLVLNLMFVTSLLALMPTINAAADTDRTPPYILSTSPANGALNIPTGNNITIKFSEKILPGPLATYNSISVLDAGGNPVAFVKNISGSTLVINPIDFLSTGTYYKVTIPTGALKDANGNKLRADYSFGFSTNQPEGDNTLMTNTTPTTNAPTSVTSITTPETTTTPVTNMTVNTPPIVNISSPANGASYTTGTSISFSGSASDIEDGNLSASLVWTSSCDGKIGEGPSFITTNLSSGTHSITTTATDSEGLSGSAQLIITVNTPAEGVSCDVLGMIPNDQTKGIFNYNKLITEVKKGTKINVNGTYYLQSPYSASSSENKVDAGLFLTGDSPANSKLILLGGLFFNIKGKALIENISIECPTTRFTYLINMDAPFVNEITIRNNYITGNIRMVSSSIPLNFNFVSTPCYVEKLIIDNNEFCDVYNNSGSPDIIRLIDTPVKSSYIRDNKITNFSYIFYDNSITNGHLFTDYLIQNNNAIIENNIVTCTDKYNPSAISMCSSMYYCFALIEGFSVECRNNVFEGFHVSNASDIVVYDNYFSVTTLLYENNTWKNNVNFTPGITNVDIMKSKFGSSVAGKKTERIYRNNKYIVETDYADRFGKDRFLLRKEINTWQTDIDSIIIEDNYFDMYILSFDYYGQMFKELYKFNRNTVTTYTTEHSVNTQAFAYIKEMKDESGNFITRDLIFTNNTITCVKYPFGAGIGTLNSYFIYKKTGSGDKTKVNFSNNNIDVPGLKLTASDIAAGINSNNVIKSY